MARPAKTILFDLDGTIYLSGVLYPGVVELVQKLNASGIPYGFLTNNSTIGPGAYLRKLRKLGLDVHQHNVLTSAEATCLMLKDLGLSQQAAEAADADTPMGALALALYAKFVEEEDGKGKDFSAMLPRFEKRSRGA